MLNYFLEFEESIGKNWDKYLRRKVNKFHEESRIYFSDISKTLNIFHHLLGGEKGKDLQITDKRYVDTKRTLLQKISFSGKEFYLTWQDEKSIYLPASFAYFPTKEQNEMLYYWLVAMATKVDIDDNNIIEQNSTAIKYLKNRYTGFDTNGDNIGDTSHKMYQYADRLWHYNNKVKFFYGSPVMTLLNFLAQVAPFIDPILLLEDSKPIVIDNKTF